LSAFNEHLNRLIKELETAVNKSQATSDLLGRAQLYCNKVLFIMDNIRHITDEAETIVSREYWPYPTYGDILFNI
jgi:glutamine synthetase